MARTEIPEVVVSSDRPSESPAPPAMVGTFSGFSTAGVPLVSLTVTPIRTNIPARSCVALGAQDVGKQVVIVLEENDPARPIVLGVIHKPVEAEHREAVLDGKTVTLTAEESLTLRCGQASITLTRDGKVVIRGGHIVSHAGGINRIRGGSVQLN